MEQGPNQELHIDFSEENEERVFTLAQGEDDSLISILVDDGADRKLLVYALNEAECE